MSEFNDSSLKAVQASRLRLATRVRPLESAAKWAVMIARLLESQEVEEEENEAYDVVIISIIDKLTCRSIVLIDPRCPCFVDEWDLGPPDDGYMCGCMCEMDTHV